MTELLKAGTESYAEERASDREAAREASTVSIDTATDPLFWRHAYCLAELEVGLIEIGGARSVELETLRTSLKGASDALLKVRTDAAPALRAFADFSEEVRNLRIHRLASIRGQEGRPASSEALDENDRALRVMPPADASRSAPGPTISPTSVARRC